MTALQVGLPAGDPVQLGAQLLGLGIAAATAAGLVALGYRWYVRERVPTGLGVLFGLSAVAAYLVPTGGLGAVMAGDNTVLASTEVLPNLAAFALGAVGSSVGIRLGDAVGTDLFTATGGRSVEADVSEIVQTVGRVTSVRLPEEIDDIIGYDPMPEATTESLSGKRFLFPRRLTKNELRDRLVDRLKTDYGVGHVDLELADDGSVEYIAVGSRAAGIGPTLPPATNAVAIRADPANAASSGDLVQVWEPDPLGRVLTGELRGVAGDVVTVAIDTADTPKLDPDTEYKLVTLPVQDRPDREFASLLRAAEETMSTVTVAAGSDLVGTDVGDLRVTVAAVTREDGSPEAIPTRERVLEAGDVVYAIGKPEALRYVEAAASRQREDGTDAGLAERDVASPDDEVTGTDTAEPPAEAEPSDDTPDRSTPVEEGEPEPTTDRDSTAEPEPSGDGGTGSRDESADPPADTEADGQSAETPRTDGEPAPTPAESDAAEDESVTVWDPEERLAGDETAESESREPETTAGDAPDGESAPPPDDGADDETDDERS